MPAPYTATWGGQPLLGTQAALTESLVRQLTELGRRIGLSTEQSLKEIGRAIGGSITRGKQMQFQADLAQAAGLEKLGAGIGRGLEGFGTAVARRERLDLQGRQIGLGEDRLAETERHAREVEEDADERLEFSREQAEQRQPYYDWYKARPAMEMNRQLFDTVRAGASRGAQLLERAAGGMKDYAIKTRGQDMTLRGKGLQTSRDIFKLLMEERLAGETTTGQLFGKGGQVRTRQYEPKIQDPETRRKLMRWATSLAFGGGEAPAGAGAPGAGGGQFTGQIGYDDQMRQLQIVRRLREMGFTQEEINELLPQVEAAYFQQFTLPTLTQ